MKLTKIQKELRLKLLTYMFKTHICHVPTALSAIDYLFFLHKHIDLKNDRFIIGNPYIPFLFDRRFYSNIKTNDNINAYPLSEYNMCHYMSGSLGNDIGIAVGMAISKKYKKIIISVGDSILHSGSELEAALYIGNNFSMMSDIFLIINSNNIGCNSSFLHFDKQLKNIFHAFKWNVKIINGHNFKQLKKIDSIFASNNNKKPICLIIKTIKGYGIPFIEKDPITWHYKQLQQDDFQKIQRYLR